VRCWGSNAYGQLGNGTTEDAREPVRAKDLENVRALAAGVGHTCAVLAAGVRCWGLNSHGQLGDGTKDDRSIPVAVTGLQ